MPTMEHRILDVDGPVHVADFGGSGPAMILVHGLGGSHVNWLGTGPLLARRARVVAPDLAGFGRTPPAGRSTGVRGNQRLLDRLVEVIAGGPAILVGNSLGGLVSIMEAGAHPDRVAGLILVDPAVPAAGGALPSRQVALSFAAQFVPGLGEAFVRRRISRLGPEGLVRESMVQCCTDPGRVPPEIMDAHVAMSRDRLRMPWANASVLRASRSMLRILLRPWAFRELVRKVEAPTLLLHGADDRLIHRMSAEAVAKTRPDWTFRVLEGIGHIPHVEAPRETVAAIEGWLDGPGRPALERAATVPPPAEAAPQRSVGS